MHVSESINCSFSESYFHNDPLLLRFFSSFHFADRLLESVSPLTPEIIWPLLAFNHHLTTYSKHSGSITWWLTKIENKFRPHFVCCLPCQTDYICPKLSYSEPVWNQMVSRRPTWFGCGHVVDRPVDSVYSTLISQAPLIAALLSGGIYIQACQPGWGH